jgi:hypothetical protein
VLTRPFVLGAAGLVVAAAVLRVVAAMNCLWFDEVWTVLIAEIQGSPWQIFYALNHSNNNHLNTLYLYYFGGQSTHWVLYRLPAIIAGAGTVVAAGRIGISRGRGAALLAMLLTACSYPLIHYSSEARGYGLAMFFDLLAFDCLRRLLTFEKTRYAVGYWFACVGSLLSHYMFVSLFPALVLWSIAELRQKGLRWGEIASISFRLNFIPAASIGIMYLLDIQHMTIGGAPDYSLAAVVTGALSLSIGGPDSGLLAESIALVSALFYCAGLIYAYRSGSRDWIFYLLAVVVIPAALFLVERPQALFVRYFLASILFSLMLLAQTLVALWKTGTAGRGIAALFVAGFLWGNGVLTVELLKYGRGDSLGVLQYMADHTVGPLVTIDSDHHDRNAMLVDFHKRFVRSNKFIVHVPANAVLSAPTEWFIAHRLPGEPPPAKELTIRGARYDLVRHDRSCSLSGWDWFVFHLRDPSAALSIGGGSG